MKEQPQEDRNLMISNAVEIEFVGGALLEYCVTRAIERASLMDKTVKFRFNNITIVASSESTVEDLTEKARIAIRTMPGAIVGPF